MSVNDLIEEWSREPDDFGAAADELKEVARTVWKPVSEPPTEEDGDEAGYIFIWTDLGVDMVKWDEEIVDVPAPVATRWARVKDVLLMPPQGGE